MHKDAEELTLRSVEHMRPRSGLSVPIVTVLDDEGSLIESDQRAVVRYVIQDGYGADVIFSAGTTGEWDRVSNRTRQQVIRVCAEEVERQNRALSGKLPRPVESWAGVTAHTPQETLENLEFSVNCGVDAAVLAPLSIPGVDDPVRFVTHDVADLLDSLSRRVPVYLYDNADIAADPKVPHIRTHQVKAMSRLDFVRGIKVSAPRKVLGNYTKAAAGFRDRGEFGIYVGNATLIFDLFRPRTGVWGCGFGALEPLPAARIAADRGGLGPRECVASRMGESLAGVSRRRLGKDAGGAQSGRQLPHSHLCGRRSSHDCLSKEGSVSQGCDYQSGRRQINACSICQGSRGCGCGFR